MSSKFRNLISFKCCCWTCGDVASILAWIIHVWWNSKAYRGLNLVLVWTQRTRYWSLGAVTHRVAHFSGRECAHVCVSRSSCVALQDVHTHIWVCKSASACFKLPYLKTKVSWGHFQFRPYYIPSCPLHSPYTQTHPTHKHMPHSTAESCAATQRSCLVTKINSSLSSFFCKQVCESLI